MAGINNSIYNLGDSQALAPVSPQAGDHGVSDDTDGLGRLAASAASEVFAQRLHAPVGMHTHYADGETAIERLARIAFEAISIARDPGFGTADSFARLKAVAEKLYGEVSHGADKDPRLANLLPGMRFLVDMLDVMSKRVSKRDVPTAAWSLSAATPDSQTAFFDSQAAPTAPLGNAYSPTSDTEIQNALATGDLFEVIYAIMKMMYGTAAENTLRRGLVVKQKNLEQEKVRSTQQELRELVSGFKPAAKADDTLKGTTGYSDEKARKVTQDLRDLGWDLSPYGGAITEKTQKQQLDDLITSMDSKLTTYNNMNSIETNDLTREGQAGQAYLMGMNSITTKEGQTKNAIATSIGR
ncbi:hypothetical protein [Achromobacter aloeverae]|uniref:Uncharacterized protein n=1 Tax=Achromobacter aloeverae TaxID=1750518 RepID=A0A4Q1HJI9_9BURK|nr:hypothetical protein [Achromobacter aloeverae]RXN87776.1 hypothetical protein C7R54_14345 [Achromobacter aloeverae]